MIGTAIRTRAWRWVRLLACVAILGMLVAQVGADPFIDGLRRTTVSALVIALLITAGTTWCCAWRWSLLAGKLGVAVPVGTAYRLYYRSQLLNATLPCGVLGDLHRAVDHGREAGALGRGLRSVFWDRATGQAVQAALAVTALALLPPAVRPGAAWGTVLAVLAVVAGLAALAVLPARLRRTLATELRTVPAAPGVWPGVVLASVLAAAGHAAVFVVAARTVGVTAPLTQLVALALLVLVASALPLSVAGWGPREGAAAWLFAVAGLGAGAGVSVAVVYGVLSLVATLPGLLVLAGHRPARADAPARALAEEAAGG